MAERIYVVPKPGASVLDPVTYLPLPVEGAWKPRSGYWQRRLEDGDVVEGAPAADPKPAPASK